MGLLDTLRNGVRRGAEANDRDHQKTQQSSHDAISTLAYGDAGEKYGSGGQRRCVGLSRRRETRRLHAW